MMIKNYIVCVNENKRQYYIFVYVIFMMFIKEMCEIYIMFK